MRRLLTLPAIAFVVAAFALGLVRLAAPRLADDPGRAAALLSDAFGMPVTVDTMTLRFRGWRPTARLTGVEITAADADAPLAGFSEVDVEFRSLLSAWRHRFAVAQIVINRLELTVLRRADGGLTLAHSGLDADAGFDPATLTHLLERERVLRLDKTRVVWRDEARGRAPVTFEDADVRLRTKDGALIVEAAAPLPGALGERVRARLISRGNPLVHGWSGRAYATIDSGNVGGILGLSRAGGLDMDGRVDAELWASIDQGHLTQVTGTARVANLSVGDAPALAPLSIGARVLPDGEAFEAAFALGPPNSPQALAVRARGRLEPVPDLETLSLRGSDLEIGPMLGLATAVAKLVPGADGDWVRQLAAADPDGLVSHIGLDFAPAIGLAYEAEIARLRSSPSGPAPGVDLGGFRISGDAYSMRLIATPQTAALTYPERLTVPLEVDLDALDVLVRLSGPGAPVLEFGELHAVAQQIPISLAGRLSLGGPQAEADLAARFGAGPLARLPELLPRGIMSDAGDRWLRRALVSGTIRGAEVALRGPLAAFPFRGTEGRFVARMPVEDAIIDYAAAWPRMEEIDFDLVFDDARLEARVAAAMLKSARLRETTVALPDLSIEDYVLEISGRVDTAWDGLTSFVRDSPLKDGGAKDLEDLDVSGTVGMSLDLAIPLETDDDTVLLGSLEFDGNDFAVTSLDLRLEDLTGVIGFTREDWYGQQLTARYDGEAVDLVVAGGIEDPNYDVELTMSALSPAPYLFAKLEEFAPQTYAWVDGDGRLEAVSGELDWRVTVTLPDAEGPRPEAPVRVEFESNLIGLDVALPWPVGKLPNEARPLRVVAYADGVTDAPYRVSLSDLVDLSWTEDASGLTAAGVRFGTVPEQPLRPGEIHLYGQLDLLPVSELMELLPDGGPATTAAVPAVPLPVTADVEVARLEVMGQTFSAMTLRAEQRAGDWQVRLSGDDLNGKLFLTGSDQRRAVVRLEELRVAAPEDEGPPLDIDPRRVPALEITCEALVFEERSLGRVAISTTPQPDGLGLNALSFRHEAFEIEASGDWKVFGNRHESRFDIQLAAPELAPMLASFGYDTSAVAGAQTRIDISARWDGTPAEFELAKLGGTLDLELTKGSLEDLEPGGGRLFGLLSLQALPRRLALDFNDLFAEGLAFDRIEGSFELSRGDAYTNDLYLAGPSARIDVAGRIGLASRDYDQRVTVVPQLSNTFPVASALFGPVGLGVGAAIYLGGQVFKGIPESVDKMFMEEYSITGSWEDPVVEQI